MKPNSTSIKSDSSNENNPEADGFGNGAKEVFYDYKQFYKQKIDSKMKPAYEPQDDNKYPKKK